MIQYVASDEGSVESSERVGYQKDLARAIAGHDFRGTLFAFRFRVVRSNHERSHVDDGFRVCVKIVERLIDQFADRLAISRRVSFAHLLIFRDEILDITFEIKFSDQRDKFQ